MIVPDYWAEARRQHRDAHGQVTVRRLGWSISSAADAAAMAERRADEALRRLAAGEKLARREPKVPYNGADGVPIREEVLARSGEDVVTRNAYGARCLNSPDALFADVDFESGVAPMSFLAAFLALAAGSVAAGACAGSWRLGAGLAVASFLLAAPAAALVRRASLALQGGAMSRAKRRLSKFLRSRPEWSVRLYRTPAGLRLLVTHRAYSPADKEALDFFRAVGTDPVYVRMCRNQQCFRARLTAKPWRIGIASHMRPRPGTWPVAPERLAVRAAWVSAYEARARAFASCRFIGSVGTGYISLRLQPVVALHDSASRALEPNLPLA